MGIADFLQNKKREQAAKNLAEEQAFLKQNKEKAGVVTTPSGLQYEVLFQSETEQKPTATSCVTCHYEGTLLNGKIFDSSVARAVPATFPLQNVIAGWTEGLQYMTVGSKFKFYIPSALGYGDRQVGKDIPPNSLLIFEVTLLSIQ